MFKAWHVYIIIFEWWEWHKNLENYLYRYVTEHEKVNEKLYLYIIPSFLIYFCCKYFFNVIFSLFTIANNSDNVVPNQLTAHRSSVWKLICSYSNEHYALLNYNWSANFANNTLNYAR